MMKNSKTVRIVTCSNCSADTHHGTTQVYRKIVFHFCAWCWLRCRLACHQRMVRC